MQVQRVEISDGWRTTITRPFSTSSSIFGMPRLEPWQRLAHRLLSMGDPTNFGNASSSFAQPLEQFLSDRSSLV